MAGPKKSSAPAHVVEKFIAYDTQTKLMTLLWAGSEAEFVEDPYNLHHSLGGDAFTWLCTSANIDCGAVERDCGIGLERVQVRGTLDVTFARWFQVNAWNKREKLASCYLRGCCHLGRYTTCDAENRFRFFKGGQMAAFVGKNKPLGKVLEATHRQSGQLSANRAAGRELDAGLDRGGATARLFGCVI